MLRWCFGFGLLEPTQDGRPDVQRLGAETEGADAVFPPELLAPLANAGILLHFVEASWPRLIVTQQERQYGHSRAYRVVVLPLGDPGHFPFGTVPPPRADQCGREPA